MRIRTLRCLGWVCVVGLVLILAVQGQERPRPREREPGGDRLRPRIEAEPEAPGQAPVGTASQAALVRLIKYSGVVKDVLGRPRTGTAGVTFALYKEQEGGAPLWLETQNAELDAQGRYTVLLGRESSEGLPLEIFASEEARWLGVQVQGDPESRSFGTGEQPRILLVSVPYALKAADAERLGGKPAEAFLLAETSSENSGKDGSNRGEKLSSGGDGTLAQVVSGTVGQIAKFTATDTVQDSIITETGGGDIGVGTTSPLGKLHVQKTGAETRLVVGNPNPVANNASDGRIHIFGEHNGVVKSVFIHNIGNSLQINGAGAGVNIQLLGAFETSILNGTSLGIYSPTNVKRVYVRHDGSQALISTFGSGAGGIAVRPGTDVTAAFQVQRSFGAGATPILSVDSVTSRVGIGTTSPAERLHIVDNLRLDSLLDLGTDACSALSATGRGRLCFNSTKFQVSENGGAYQDLLGGGVGGSGTATQVAFWDTSSSLSSNANLFWDNTNSRLGIGTATPGAALEVAGQVKITGGSPGVGKVLTSDADGLANWQAAGGVPSGVIVMWSGSLASIPSGWALCDGTNGTPDLRTRFIMGVATAENPGATGGSTSHAHAVNPHTHSVDPAVVQSSGPQEPSSDVTAGSGILTIAVVPANHTHTVDIPSTTTSSNGSTTDSQDHLPPFFKLAFIMKL